MISMEEQRFLNNIINKHWDEYVALISQETKAYNKKVCLYCEKPIERGYSFCITKYFLYSEACLYGWLFTKKDTLLEWITE